MPDRYPDYARPMISIRTASYLTSFFTSLALLSLSNPALSAQAAASPLEPQFGIAMHGEPKYPKDFTHFDYVNPDAPKGGTLRMSVILNGYDSFNPFTFRGVAAAGVRTYVYDTLLESSADEPFSSYGLIAESIETPPDRSYVIFNIRKEARFQDGEPITAEDVKFTLNTLTTKGHPRYKSYYESVTGVTIENSHRIRFDFAKAKNRELPLILGQLPILPAHYWKEHTFGENSLTPPVGSGPYRIGEFEAGRSVTYERVKDYWAKDLGLRKGRFNFDYIRYDYYTDDTVALESFRAGNFDFRLESSAKNWATAYTGPRFDDGTIITEAIEHHRPTGMQAFIYNTRHSKFSDPKVREALAYAFDFEWANKNLFYGQYTRTDSYFENSDLASSGLPEGRELGILEPFREQLSEEVFTRVYEPPTTSAQHTIRENLRTALELLRAAGYTNRDGKLVNKETGKPLAFEILLTQKSMERVALPFKDKLALLGVDVTIHRIDSNQYAERLKEFDYDMTPLVIRQSDSPGNEQRDYWGSSSVEVPGSGNYMGVSDPVVDQLVEMVIQAPGREELVHRVRALDRVLLHGYYVIPHWYLASDRIAYWNKLQRPDITPKDGIDLNNWWIRQN